ncbi:hypothetical protein ASPACDRAFT_46796 [Aspergillus aculeatus ATCC 16872]|uniref:Uncharacterized protein n=1 Tax=Aspergillus aculeatus (strain ATCC 16872 / CBS 172.66 / WB 5094) TaxID=690307 RepID=A0A1L9WKD6_ASPA1|nr:uncharacterized protein ASPACDRAFT_46796 [Aspergillus aculeatus ATCC 16872]OJJ96625.1 hypothetical protein ASPACDRAFT_46796 [Aspergillus aculeatus ATCC 16872]
MKFSTVMVFVSGLAAGVLAAPVPSPLSTGDLDTTHFPVHEQSTGHSGSMPNSNPLHGSARSPQILGTLRFPLPGSVSSEVKGSASIPTKRQSLSIAGNLPLSITIPQDLGPAISVSQPSLSITGLLARD